ncbi:MAG: DUF2971 domain-containing protein [Nitrosopumilus sp.]
MNKIENRVEINPIVENLDKLPKILYKYRTFDNKGYGLKMATTGEVYFASGKEFNDPFECYFIPISKLIEYEGAVLEKYLRKKAFFHLSNPTEEEVEDFITHGLEQHEKLKNGDPSAMDAVMEVQYRNFGILPLVDTAYSIPMWAYYSDSFTGLCVGFDVKKLGEHQLILSSQKQVLILNKVVYQKDILKYNIDVGSKDFTEEELNETEALYFIKSDHWEHESEYRMIFSDFVSNSYSFGTSSIAEIIVGLRAEESDIEELKDHLRKSKSTAQLKRLTRSHSKFELGFEDLDY